MESKWMRRVVVPAALVAVLGSVVLADGDADKPIAPPSLQQQVVTLEREITALFAAGKYADAAEKCRAEAALIPSNPNPSYNLACALARLGKKDDAMAALAKSVELGFDDADHMKVDEDLASLHEAKGFDELVTKAAVGSYQPGLDAVPGVKSFDRAPKGGLRYRLLVPEGATAKAPARLIVWLHPSGGSMNEQVQKDAAAWFRAGFALLAPTQKSWGGWTQEQTAALLDQSVPDAGTVEGVDAKRPILMGFSAGGQVALSAWAKDPARFGAIVADAAYPLDIEAWQRGQRKPIEPAPGDASKNTPVYVLVG